MKRRTVWVLLRVDTPSLTYIEGVWTDRRSAQASLGSRANWLHGAGCWYAYSVATGRHAWTLVRKPLREERG